MKSTLRELFIVMNKAKAGTNIPAFRFFIHDNRMFLERVFYCFCSLFLIMFLIGEHLHHIPQFCCDTDRRICTTDQTCHQRKGKFTDACHT